MNLSSPPPSRWLLMHSTCIQFERMKGNMKSRYTALVIESVYIALGFCLSPVTRPPARKPFHPRSRACIKWVYQCAAAAFVRTVTTEHPSFRFFFTHSLSHAPDDMIKLICAMCTIMASVFIRCALLFSFMVSAFIARPPPFSPPAALLLCVCAPVV